MEESGLRVAETVEVLNYRTLAGYDSVIHSMRDIGIGMQDDEKFKELVTLLNTRHGVDRMPTLDTLLFRAPAREDANRFVAATIGELGLPVVRMHMEESLQGLPLLCRDRAHGRVGQAELFARDVRVGRSPRARGRRFMERPSRRDGGGGGQRLAHAADARRT